MLEKCIEIKNAKANAGKKTPNCNIVNAIGGNNLKTLKRPNKGKKHNGNTPKGKNNKTKKLALLGKGFNK